eukprot:4431097-Pyramimonas_sp.AAC.1
MIDERGRTRRGMRACGRKDETTVVEHILTDTQGTWKTTEKEGEDDEEGEEGKEEEDEEQEGDEEEEEMDI